MDLSLSQKLRIRFNSIRNLGTKKLIFLHFHIFKNAGSSIKHMLHKNFGNKHFDIDKPYARSSISFEDMLKQIEDKNKIMSVSSHQLSFPLMDRMNHDFFSVIFLRNPITRAKSVYDYVAKYDSSEYGDLARKYSFDEWVKKSLNSAKFATEISNLQSARLLNSKNIEKKVSFANNKCIFDLEESFNNLKSFDFKGRVENFKEDSETMCLKAKDKGLFILNIKKTHKNKSPNNNSLENVINCLSTESYEMLVSANKLDFELYKILEK